MGNQIERSAGVNSLTRRELFGKLFPKRLGSDVPITHPINLGIDPQNLVTDSRDPHPSILTLPFSRRTGLKAAAATTIGGLGGALADHLRPTVDNIIFATQTVIKRRIEAQAAETSPVLLNQETKYYFGPGDQERVISQRDNENYTLFHTKPSSPGEKTKIQKKGPNGEAITIAEGIGWEISDGKLVYVSSSGQIRTQNLDTGVEYLVSETGDMPWIYKNKVVYLKNNKIYRHDATTGQETSVFATTDKITALETPVIYGNTIVWPQFNSEITRWEINIYDEAQQKFLLDKPISDRWYDYRRPSLWKNNLGFMRYPSGSSPDTDTPAQPVITRTDNLTNLVRVNESAPYDTSHDNIVVADTMGTYTIINPVPGNITKFPVVFRLDYPDNGTALSYAMELRMPRPTLSQNPNKPHEATARYAGYKKGPGVNTTSDEVFSSKIITQGIPPVPDYRMVIPKLQIGR